MIGINRNAHAAGYMNRLSLKLKLIIYRLYNVSGHLIRVRDCGQISHIYQKLITADAADHIAALKHILQHFGRLLQ